MKTAMEWSSDTATWSVKCNVLSKAKKWINNRDGD